MNISVLRKLIRTGEFLEQNPNDSPVRDQWIFDVEDYLDTLDSKYRQRVFHAIATLKSYSSSMQRELTRVRSVNISLIMGLLRSLYNRDSSENKPLISESQAVFIVHGHDNSLIEEVKNCINSLGLKPIVLREQPDKGKTIIEKLEEWLGNCKCAVVLYTPCDIGRSVSQEKEEKRARQNVVYEHGLFQGYLGRKRVIVLKKGETSLPGDCSGIVYTSIDNDHWTEQLKNNIQAIDI